MGLETSPHMAAKKTAKPSAITAPHEGPWGVPPAEATRWTAKMVRGSQNIRLTHENEDEGVEELEFPLEDLSIATLREWWGSGRYQLQWMGDAAGKRIACGNARPFTLTPQAGDANFVEPEDDEEEDDEDEDDEEEESDEVAPPPPTVFDPMATALQMVGVVNSLKAQEVSAQMQAFKDMQESAINMARLMFDQKASKRARKDEREASRRAEENGMAGMGAALGEIAKAVQAQGEFMLRQSAEMEALKAQLAQGQPSDPTAPFVVAPGDSIASVATATIANQVVQQMPNILGGVGALANAYLDSRQEKKKAAENAQQQAAASHAASAMRSPVTVPFTPNAAPASPPPPPPEQRANTGLPPGDPIAWSTPKDPEPEPVKAKEKTIIPGVDSGVAPS